MSTPRSSPRRASRSRSRSISRSRQSSGDEYRRFDANDAIPAVSTPMQPLEMESSTPKPSPLNKITSALRSQPHPLNSRSDSLSSHSANKDNAPTIPTRHYKGFSTPLIRILHTISAPSLIADTTTSSNDTSQQQQQFRNETDLPTAHLRSDLCSLSLFGILSWDRSRYLLTHHRPPTLCKRLCLHLLIPGGLFLIAGWMSGHIINDYINNLICTTLVWCVILWICVGCVRGRKKRVMIREEILWRLKRREEKLRNRTTAGLMMKRGVKRGWDRLNNNTSEETEENEEEDYEYYSEDEEEYERQVKNLGLLELGQTRREMNCAHGMCGCYPSDLGRYNNEYNDNSESLDDSIRNAIHKSCCDCFTSPCLPCLPLGTSHGFHIQFCGLCAIAQEAREADITIPRHLRMIDYITMEPFLSYYPRILELRRSRNGNFMEHCRALSRLSVALLRAWGVILLLLLGLSLWKAIGYWKLRDMVVLCATFLQAFTVMWAMHWGWHRFDLSVDAVIKYFACGFALCTGLAFTTELIIAGVFRLIVMGVIWGLGVTEVVDNGYGGQGMHVKFNGAESNMYGDNARVLSEESDILYGFFSRHPAAQVIYVLVSSYLVAGLIDELCKYFGFLMVDHPDFSSEKELAKAHSSLPLQLLRDRAFRDDDSENEHGVTTVVREDEATSLADFDPSRQKRSPASIRAGVTVAMVAVALGFACCENILHIFIYNRSSLRSEIGVLIVKSLFPIHPICAAIQSIQVCKRDLEKNSSIGVGRILFVSVLLHGSYDAALLFINQSWQRTKKDNYFYEGSSNGKVGVAVISGVTSMLILATGILYYLMKSSAQYSRLRGKSARVEGSGVSLESGFLT